ncbi:hypothetical protein [Planctellipticum variicoloris]|jgi:hypothetical protein|uniref:hypothetical protein n=1 Tax=Planctellipticum variicoloris TaxID=3064265 RepID=UPI002BE91FB1|nr:hypothetical protein SH412_005127 [Planctomycetaceae bacterium SH412]HTN00497.1 hypothetical protein [Planctomycetaceae bacterium]
MHAKTIRYGFATALLAGSTVLSLSGCEEPKQKVLDIKAPGVDIEVERSKSGSDTKIETGDESSGTKLEIDSNAKDGSSVKVEPKE